MTTELTTVEIKPKATHRYSIIWLHGLGADGHDFEGIAQELHLNAKDEIHFVFPDAPIQPVTINGGMSMRAWYDIVEMSLERKVDIDGIYESAALINQLIQKEIDAGIASDHILLAGFSQGGVIALHAGLRFGQRLGGIMALSTYLPTLEQLKTEAALENAETPILMAHGILDSVVDIEAGKRAFDTLSAMGYKLVWHDYMMEHSVCIEEIEHLSAFINSIFKDS